MTVLENLIRNRIVAIVRTPDFGRGLDVVYRIIDAGIMNIEVTLTTPGAIEIIETLSAISGVCVGAGTVLNANDIPLLHDAGAQFIVSPHASPAVISATKTAKLISIPAVATSNEVALAIDAGADILKLFPASTFGPSHLRALRDPFPDNLWCPTGGISVEAIPEWFSAGANLVGIGGPLFKGGIDNIASNVCAFKEAVGIVSL